MGPTLGYFLILLLEWWYGALVKLKNSFSKCQDQAVGATGGDRHSGRHSFKTLDPLGARQSGRASSEDAPEKVAASNDSRACLGGVEREGP